MKSLIGIAAAAVFAAATASAADLAAGKRVYDHTCAACHGLTGLGAFPSMPDLRKKGGVLAQPDSVLLDRIEHGYKGPGSQMAMPPKGGNASLTRNDLANALAWMHHEFGVSAASRSGVGSASRSEAADGNQAATGRPMMGQGMMGHGMSGGMMGR